MSFFCDKCGLCCRCSNEVEELRDFMNDNNMCKYFDEDTNLCTIYENRPDICNVDKCYTMLKFNESMSKEEFYKLNEKCCESLKSIPTNTKL